LRLVVTKLSVRSFDLDHLDLYWEIESLAGPAREEDTHEIFDYDFYILRRGDTQYGDFEQVGGPFRDTYRFRDGQVSLLHKWRDYYYKLRVVHRVSGEIFETEAASFEADRDLIAIEIIRQEDLLFREFIGRKCYLFPRRTFGPRCSCYDVVLGRITRSAHLLCFGTGFLGGYHAPIESFVQVDPNPKSRTENSLQEGHHNDTSARLISFPPVSPDDILVESENRRWVVKTVTPTERLRGVVRQELTMHEVPRGDIEFALPLNVDLATLQSSAKRNFTNPQNLETDGDYADLISFFNRPGGVSR
jgi:hypothetical protein